MRSKGEQTKARVLETAIAIVNRNGIRGTSVKDIIDATGVKKGNLYFHFSSKEELTLEILRMARTEYEIYIQSRIKSTAPLEKLMDILSAVAQWHRKRRFVGGCIFGNTALETSDENRELSSFIRDTFDGWRRLFSGLLEEARRDGLLNPRHDPDSLALHILTSLEGSIMMCRLTKKEEALKNCIRAIRQMLEMD